MDKLGILIDLGYAKRDFQRTSDDGHPLVERCLDWWDELVSGIRYPVAYCHVVTGTLPGGYVSHTAAAISTYDRDGKPVAKDAVTWADCASAETDEECYRNFSRAIREKAAELGARSLFEFAGETLRSSVSIAHDPQQGPTWFEERTYGKREPKDAGGRSPESQAAADDMTAIRLAGQPRWESVAKEDRSDNFWLEVSWTRVKEVVPDEAVALEKLLAALELNMEQFCHNHDCEDVPEESDDAWDRLSQKFQAATGLTLWPFWNPAGLNRIEPDTGFLVIGALRLTAAGRSFFQRRLPLYFGFPL